MISRVWSRFDALPVEFLNSWGTYTLVILALNTTDLKAFLTRTPRNQDWIFLTAYSICSASPLT